MNDSVKKAIIYLSVAFVIISVWRDPAGSARVAGDFLGTVGGFFSTVIDKVASFIKGLGD